MKTMQMFKAPFQTKMFNKNQKLWIVYAHGMCGYCVVGKYRGNGRYVKAFISFDTKERRKLYPPKIIEVEVKESFLKDKI